MRAKLLAFVSALSLVLTAVVVTAPSAEAKGFPGWTRTRLTVASMNSILQANGLGNFDWLQNSSGPQGRKPGPPFGNNFSNFLQKQTNTLVFRVRKGFNGALPAMTLNLRGPVGKRSFTLFQTNTNGIISLYFEYNGKKIYFSPT